MGRWVVKRVLEGRVEVVAEGESLEEVLEKLGEVEGGHFLLFYVSGEKKYRLAVSVWGRDAPLAVQKVYNGEGEKCDRVA